MRGRIVLILIALLTTANAGAETIWRGAWVGIVSKSDGSSWSVRVTPDPASFRRGIFGSIEYPSLGCGGSLKLDTMARGGDEVWTTETFGYGRDVCHDKGVIRFSSDESNDRVAYFWSRGGDTTWATLERSSSLVNRILDKASEYLDPEDNAEGLISYGEAMARAGRAAEVRQKLVAAADRMPNDWRAAWKSNFFRALAEAWLTVADTPAAIRLLERSKENALNIEKEEDRARDLALSMITAARAGARKHFNDLDARVVALSVDPVRFASAVQYRAEAWHWLGETEKARAILEAAAAAHRVSTAVERSSGLWNLATAFAMLGDMKRASELLDAALEELDEAYPEGSDMVMKALAGVLIHNSRMDYDDIDRVLARARAGFDGKPNDLELGVAARRLADAGRFEEAIAVAEETRRALDEQSEYRVNRLADVAEVLAIARQGKKSIELFNVIAREIKENPPDDFGLGTMDQRLALIAARLGYYDVAIGYAESLPFNSSTLDILLAIAEIAQD